jgi:CobQ-like glutamine amidotransferase family enzyme
MKIVVGHLYPDLLNLYGDRGNIISIKKRCQWRGLDVEVKQFSLNDDIDFGSLDIVFIGGGSDREQLLVGERLLVIKNDFQQYIENQGVTLTICGGYQLLGHYYKMQNEKINALGILDIYTESEKGRLIGNVVIQSDFLGEKSTLVGFENHGGRTYINSHTPLGKTITGFGNNGKDKGEGIIYKNTIGTYLHGPVLPKNPNLTDFLIFKALEKKYKFTKAEFDKMKLNDELEYIAHNAVIKRVGGVKI